MTLVLHIGFPKTGTTSLQTCLRKHENLLAQNGTLYPLPTNDFKQRSLKLLVSTTWQQADDHDVTLRKTRDMMVQFTHERPDGHIILSCEELANAFMSDYSDAALGRLRDFLEPWLDDLRIIAYLRSPEEYYLPIMQESLKRSVDIIPPSEFRTDYAQIIGRFEQALGAPATVRVFDRATLRGGDLVEDFLHEIKDLVDLSVSKLERPTSNETLPAEILFLLDLVQHSSVFPDSPAHVSKEHAERFWRALRDVSIQAGPLKKPILFESAAQIIASGNRQDRSALSRRYGITFPDYVAAPNEPANGTSDILSGVETVTPVDRHLAFRIWGMWSYQVNQSIHDGRMRETISTNELHSLRGKLSASKRRLSEMKTSLSETEDRLSETNGRLSETKDRLSETKNRIEAFETSTWWRIGAPLRAIKRQLGRF